MLGYGRLEVTTIPECLQLLELLAENTVQRLVTGVRNAVRFAYHADELNHESMQSIQTSLGLIFFDGFTDVLSHHLKIPLICDGSQHIQLAIG
nr:hypothetical protein [Snodgrassella alvi]